MLYEVITARRGVRGRRKRAAAAVSRRLRKGVRIQRAGGRPAEIQP